MPHRRQAHTLIHRPLLPLFFAARADLGVRPFECECEIKILGARTAMGDGVGNARGCGGLVEDYLLS